MVNNRMSSIKCAELLDDQYNDFAAWNKLSYLVSCGLVNQFPMSTSITVAATAGRHAGWTTEGSWFDFQPCPGIYLFFKSSRPVLGPSSILLNGYRERKLTNHL